MSLLPTFQIVNNCERRKPTIFKWTGLLILATLLLVLVIAIRQDTTFSDPHQIFNVKREVGNLHVATDIYGLGVRIGIYFQGLTQLFNLVKPRTNGRSASTLFVTASVGVAMLTSWLKQARANAISPAESVVILSVVMAVVPVSLTESIFLNPQGNGIGVSFLYLFVVFHACTTVWFWTTGYKSMPLLGTRNVTWCLKEVRIDHGFHVFASIVAVFMVLSTTISLLYTVTNFMPKLLRYWRDELGKDNSEDAVLSSRRLNSWIGVMGLVISIVIAEMTIKYNGLSPQDDLSLPGQLIPLVLGLATFADVFWNFCKPRQAEPFIMGQSSDAAA